MGDPLRNRCAWVASGERCRYVGVWSIDTRGGDRYFCRGHSVSDVQDDPMRHGAMVAAASYRDVGADFDWSSEACRYRSKNAYRAALPGNLALKNPLVDQQPLII